MWPRFVQILEEQYKLVSITAYYCATARKCWFPLRRTLFAGTASVSSSLRSCGAFCSCCSRWKEIGLPISLRRVTAGAVVFRRLHYNQQKALSAFLFKIFKQESGRLFLKTPAEKRNKLDPTGTAVIDSSVEEASVSSAESERNSRPSSLLIKCKR